MNFARTPSRIVLAILSLAVLPLLSLLPASEALAFRIIVSSSGGAGIAQAPCCDTSFDGGFEISTATYTGTPLAPNVLNAGGSKTFDVPRTDAAGSFTTISLGSDARASMFDIGASAWVDLESWDEDFTGESIESYASARLEQVFTPSSAADLYVRPVFQIEGNVTHADGLTSSMSFVMRPTGGPDIELFRITGGTPGTTDPVDEQLIGPDLFLPGGTGLFLSLQLTTQVSGSVNGIAEGDQFGEADAFNTLTLIGFETYTDPELSVPANVDFLSDTGETLSTVPEPGTALLLGLGLLGLAHAGRTRGA